MYGFATCKSKKEAAQGRAAAALNDVMSLCAASFFLWYFLSFRQKKESIFKIKKNIIKKNKKLPAEKIFKGWQGFYFVL